MNKLKKIMSITMNKVKDNFRRLENVKIFTRIKFNRRKLGILGLFIFAIALVFFIFASSSTLAAWFDNQWQYRKKMVFNNSGQSTNLTNFPVMIALTSSNFDFTQAQSTGYDIRFTDSNGTTILNYEREKFDPINLTATFWVMVPQINASSNDDYVYMYWGNPDAIDGQNTDNTWNSNYKGVWHLDDNTTSTAVVDSSGNANDLTTAENTTKYTSNTGQINSDFVTAGTPTTIKNQDGSYSEVFPDIELDSNGYPVIAYTDYTDYDLMLLHCNDKDCKGDDESLQVVYAIGTTGYYPSIKLDASGYPVIAFYDSSGGNLMLVHCNDVDCAGSNESIEIVESTNDTGYYPSLQLDVSGFPVISYYYGTGADLKLAHCNDVNCAGSNENINTVDSTGTVGNYANGNSLVLDSSGYPVIAYNDDTNNDLKIAHCNDANCAGSNESLTAPLSVVADDSGLYSKALQLDGSGYPMVSFMNSVSSTYYSTYLHCDDVNCAGDETTNRVTIYASTAYYSDMKKNSSGNPVFFIIVGNVYPYVFTCTTTACSSITSTALALYNQYSSTGASMALDGSNNVYAVSYNFGEVGLYDTVLYTTESKIARSYDSDFNFGTGSFSASMWFKSNSDIQQNFLLSRYDADQGYKIWLNYAGQPCFGIDDDASWGPDDYACTTPASITQNIDNGNASSVTYVDFVLDASGYPVIAYLDATPNDLEVIHCNDANCSGANESYANVDTSANSVGHYPSIKLDASGKPVIAYYDATDTNLKVVHCGDANCSTGNVINAIDVAATSVGAYPSLQLDGSGYPVIGYYDTTNTAIKLVHCNDVNCSGGDESIVTVDNTEYDIPYITTTWMQLDSSGYPVMAYTNLSTYDLKIAHCTNANCTGVTLNTPDSTGTTGYFPSLQLDGSGYPVIAYQYASGGNLRLMHCNDVNCAGTNETISTFSADTLGAQGNYYIDLDLTSAGYPVITHTKFADWNVLVTVCNDVNCAGNDESTSEIREDPYNYLYASLELDTSNKPVVLTRRAGDMSLLHFSNATSYTDTNRMDTNTWHHLVAVKNGTSSISLYLDGVLAASDVSLAATGTLTSDSAVLRLAEDMVNGLSVYNWSGHIDEVQIDSTARSADWVKAQYLSESNTYVNIQSTEVQGGPVGYFKFDETIYPVAHNTVWQKTGTNTNLERNPSLETNMDGWSGWNNSGSATRERSSEKSLFGGYSFKQSVTADGNQEGDSYGGLIDEGKTYTVSFWVNVPSVGTAEAIPFYYRIYYDGSNTILGTIATITSATNGWVRYSQTQTIPVVGHTNNNIQLSFYTNKAGTVVYVDGVQIEESSVTNGYCDGSLIGSGNHAWNGTAHGSTSTCDIGTDADISDGVMIKSADQCVANGCLAFNGSTGNVTVYDPVNHVFDQTDALTIEAWIRPINAGQNNYGRVIANVSGVDVFVQNLSGNTLSFCAQTQGTTDSCSTNSLKINEWNHIAVVYTDGNSRNFYINGKLDTANDSTNNLTNSTSNKVIGNIVGGTRAFNGSIDEVKIYPYARSTNQVKADFNDGESHAQSIRGSSMVAGDNINNNAALTDGLVGYWKMDEAVANTCAGGANDSCDSSGNVIDGAWIGNATTAVGKFGNGVSFDNVGDAVSLGSPANLDFGNNGSFTFAGWIKPTTLADYDAFISKDTAGRNAPYSYMTVFMSDGRLMIYNSSAWITLCAAGSVVTGSWQHVVFNYNGITMTGYVNGKSCGSVAFTYPDNSAYDVSIGSWYAPSTAYDFNGTMDDVRIYNRAFTPAEVGDLYNFAPGPVGDWNLNENQGTDVFDTSGNNSKGTLYSGTTWTNGKYSSDVTFNGTTGYVSIPDNNYTDYNYNQDFSVMTWVKVPSAAQNNVVDNDNCIVEKWDGNGAYSYVIRYYNTDHHIYAYRYDGTHVPGMGSTATYNDDKYHHVAFVKSGATLYLYIDGVIDGSTSDTTNTTTTNSSALYLGKRGNNANYFTGSIDDLRIYNYARTTEQIIEDMNAGHPTVSSPVGNWGFDEGYGTLLHNSGSVGSTINGNMGAGAAAPTWTSNGRVNKSLSFDGGDYISITDNVAFDIDQNGFTYSAWIKGNNFSNQTYNMIMGHYLPYFNVRSTGTLHMSMTAASAQQHVYGVTTLNTGQWYHVATTYDNLGYMKVYLDGKLDGTAGPFLTPGNTSSSQYIGTWANTLTYPFNGFIDEVKVYNYALTEDEIKVEYNNNSNVSLGSNLIDSTGTPAYSAASEYCVSGSAASCNGPVTEIKYDEGVGTTAYDTSGNTNNALLVNSPVWDIGQFGPGIKLNGSTNYAYIADHASLKGMSGLSVSTWINMASLPASSYSFIPVNKEGAYRLLIGDNGAGHFVIATTNNSWYSSGTYALFSSGICQLNSWCHIEGTYDGQYVRVFINGILQGKGSQAISGSIISNTSTVDLGAGWGSMAFYNGSLDQFRIYNYARNESQIAWDYNRGKPAGWWKLDECQLGVAHDASGLGNDGTISIGGGGTQSTVGNCDTAGTAWGNGKNGRYSASLNFDGTDDNISSSITATNGLDILGPISYSAWFKRANTGEYQTIVSKLDSCSNPLNGFIIRFYLSGTLVFQGYKTSSVFGLTYTDTTLFNDTSNWHHVVATWDGTTATNGVKMYIDGKLVTQGTSSADAFTSLAGYTQKIGSLTCNAHYFAGQIDEVKVFSYALSANQVRNIFNNDAVYFGR